MKGSQFVSSLRERRAALGFSQTELANKVSVSRQALGYIETGRQIPSTQLALELAASLRCSVDDLFQLASGSVVLSRLASPLEDTERLIVGQIGGVFVSHPLYDTTKAADGVFRGFAHKNNSDVASVELLANQGSISANILVAGCAPLLGVLCSRVERQYADMRATWIPSDSSQSLGLLEQNLVHVAGIHLASSTDPHIHLDLARHTLPDQTATIINLACWQQGLVVPRGNPMQITGVSDLLEPSIRCVQRNPGSGAQELLGRLLKEAGQGLEGCGSMPLASSHAEVARMVSTGVADTGVAIEAVAISEGLDFITLSDERFDLVLPEAHLELPAVARFVNLLDQPNFRSEAAKLPGYDLSLSGHLSTLRPH
ncbi:MAG: hypothetical protein CME30_00180 [Gemmatimonadetes bacterium]|nr:hypothetical protein [Gemmatimonadota bacterium]